MKIVRFEFKNEIYYGVLQNDVARVISSPFESDPIYLGISVPLSEIKLLAPSAPSKIVAAGLNYRAHTKELSEKEPSEPLFFIKPSTSVIAPFDDVPIYKSAGRTDYEAELAVVIKKECRNVSPDKIGEYILGYTVLNDVTARVLQKKDGQWTRAKGFDGYSPIGPVIETELDTKNLEITAKKDGVTVQHGTTADMIWDAATLVSFASGIMTLLPGDIVSTGTPPGIGEARDGETVEITVSGIGTLKNTYRLKD
ncbi:MAG: fumarylacetoacetate hydrolase family protein [Clostridia bacterium]|nr:fumarylacetoacetate hydrolase family protein [Clostridia bacterium]